MIRRSGLEGWPVGVGFAGLAVVGYTLDPAIGGLLFFGGLLAAGISVAITPTKE